MIVSTCYASKNKKKRLAAEVDVLNQLEEVLGMKLAFLFTKHLFCIYNIFILYLQKIDCKYKEHR